MKISKLGAVAALVLVVSIGAVVSAQRPHRRGPFGFGPLSGVLHSITLTSDQETQIKQIITNNRSQLQAAGQQLFQARCAYDQGVITGSGDLTTLAANLTAAEANATAVHTTVLQAVSKVLTADQISTISQSGCNPPPPRNQ